MNVQELYQTIRTYLDDDNEIGSYTVVITLSDRSVGARAGVGIRNAAPGFDWEHRQFRIEPEQKIFQNIHRMELPIGTVREEWGGQTFNACSRCHGKVALSDKFCRHCGQRLR